MRSVREILSDFGEMGSRHYFQMHSGHEYEGWIVSVEDDHILFVDCDPKAGKEEFKVRLGTIDIGTLAYHDEEQGCWVNVRWDETLQQWSQSVIPKVELPPEPAPPVRESFWGKLRHLKPSAASQTSALSKPSGNR